MIIKDLENKHLIINSKTANDALSCIINAHKESKREEYVDGLTTNGYYLLNGKIKVIGATQNISAELDAKKVKACIDFLNFLADKGWRNKNIFPTVLKWGLIAPFSFSIKFNSDEFFPWLQLYGCGQTGKTTLGNLVLYVWNLDKRSKSIGFTNIDSVARFGFTVSKDTYPILVNEVGPLYTNNFGRYTSIVEQIKHSVENITCRGRFYEGKTYQEILALSPMILTSNYGPPSDGSYNRRFVTVHFPKEEKKEPVEQDEFKRLFNENRQHLSVLGDFAAFYMLDNPSLLINKPWQDVAKEILAHFYKLVKTPIPEWLEYFEEQRDVIDESSEKTLFELRSFLLTKINEMYSKSGRFNNPQSDPDILSKLDYCIKYKSIPFISEVDESTLIITIDIMQELKLNQCIENLTGLKDVGEQLGFNYVNKNVNGKKRRVLEGTKEDFVKFINTEIK